MRLENGLLEWAPVTTTRRRQKSLAMQSLLNNLLGFQGHRRPSLTVSSIRIKAYIASKSILGAPRGSDPET